MKISSILKTDIWAFITVFALLVACNNDETVEEMASITLDHESYEYGKEEGLWK